MTDICLCQTIDRKMPCLMHKTFSEVSENIRRMQCSPRGSGVYFKYDNDEIGYICHWHHQYACIDRERIIVSIVESYCHNHPNCRKPIDECWYCLDMRTLRKYDIICDDCDPQTERISQQYMKDNYKRITEDTRSREERMK